MINYLKQSLIAAFTIISVAFTFIPESLFQKTVWVSEPLLSQFAFLSKCNVTEVNTVISRIVFFLILWCLSSIGYVLLHRLKTWRTFKGDNYVIRVEYGNILEQKDCKRVISFDECFTDHVGSAIADINPNSICGQYLAQNTAINIQDLIEKNGIQPGKGKSKYQKQTRYTSGTLVPNGNDLLMAFAKLDEKGKGRFFSRDEYLECLNLLWKEIENYYGENDVCIPIVGAGTTSIDGGAGASISKQELLNMILWSYKLSSHKIKNPYKLRIVCKRSKGFSLYGIDE